MNFLQSLPKPFFVLAPMDEVTETVFRQIVAGCAPPDLFFTEFVNVDGLQSPGRSKLLKKLRFAASETSLVAQLWGLNPDNFYKTAAQIADGSLARELGLPTGCNFVGVDLNMGCPAKSEVSNGACSALIKNRPLAAEITTATKQGLAGRLPLSVKTRLGFNEVDLTWIEFLLSFDLAMLTLHGRTRKEMSKVPAHWDLIAEARRLRDKLAPQTLFVGNGDVQDRAHGEALAASSGVDGVMIGRGVFQNPFCFSRDADQAWEACDREMRIALYQKHVGLFAATWPAGQRNIKMLNKFCKLYLSGFDGAKELREALMDCGDYGELQTILANSNKFSRQTV